MISIKKSQFSVIEVIFLVLLFSVISSYVFFDFKIPQKDYNLLLETSLDSIYYSEDYRQIIIDESLILSSLTEDWSQINVSLEKMLGDFELIVLDGSRSKVIVSCVESSGKVFDERIITVDSGDSYDFRKIRLGVCY